MLCETPELKLQNVQKPALTSYCKVSIDKILNNHLKHAVAYRRSSIAKLSFRKELCVLAER